LLFQIPTYKAVFRTKSNRQSFKALITHELADWLSSIASIIVDGRTIIPVIFLASQQIGRDLQRSPSPSPRPKEPVMLSCLTDAGKFGRIQQYNTPKSFTAYTRQPLGQT